MATTKDRALSRQLSTLFNIGAIRELTDGQLLERFAQSEGEAAELAFAALVERHGAMVMRVCRAHLPDPHDRQDAFQATFLVLVEKARGLWVRDSLGPWLHQVAVRTASCARAAAIRRKRLEHRAAEIAASRDAQGATGDPDLARVLHEEIERLPERYRVPIVLCDLEGQTCEEAARVMGRPVGTIKCWRSRGRERLRDRLIRAGVAPSVAAGAAMTGDVARAAVAASADRAVRAAARVLSDGMGAGVVPASVSMLVKGVMRSMYLSKLRTAAVGLCVLTSLGLGIAAAVQGAGDEPNRPGGDPTTGKADPRHTAGHPIPPRTATYEEQSESWPMSLREAIRIGLSNSEIIGTVASGEAARPDGVSGPSPSDPGRKEAAAAPIVLAQRYMNVAPTRFKSELMAEVRSIEQQYWNLSVAQVQLQAAREAVALAREAVKREEGRKASGRGSDGDVAEAAQRLEQFNLDLVTRTSDAITTERQLRNLLGLPPADNRRIVPVTPPTEGRVEPDWDTGLAAMLEKQPDILQAREQVSAAERRASSSGVTPPAEASERTYTVERQKAYLRQVIHQTTHSLARFYLEIDANYKQFRSASRLRAAAGERLEVQRSEYEAGRITADRFCDAVSQHMIAVTTEAQYKATYNISIIAMEEAKGTLLEYDRIVVADAPQEKDAPAAALLDGAVRIASHQPEPSGPAPASPDGPAAPLRARDETAKPDATGKTYSFHLTIGPGPRPFEIRGSFTVAPAAK